MPKQPGGVAKTKRFLLVLEILRKWKSLTTPEIVHRCAQVLGVERHSLAQSVYRDLIQMENEGLITKVFLDKTGVARPYDESEKSKGATAQYQYVDVSGGLEKIDLLHRHGYFLLLPSGLRNSVKLTTKLEPDSKVFALSWMLSAGTPVTIQVDKDMAPFEIVFCRSPAKVESKHQLVWKEMGFRSIFIGIPDVGISRSRDLSMPGHFSIGLDAGLQFFCKDFGSRNGVLAGIIMETEIRETLKTFGETEPATFYLKNLPLGSMRTRLKKIKGASDFLALPTMICAGDSHEFFVY